jgi:hypothetical protein
MLGKLSRKVAGHAWTIAPTLRHRVTPRTPPASTRWSRTFETDAIGKVRIKGKWRSRDGSNSAVVLVHGLGGHDESAYIIDAAIAVERFHHSCLRLALRGAGQTGEDLYCAGLTEDLHQALADPVLADYDQIFVVGFSLGGHIALRATIDGLDERVAGVAAICPPIDLRASQQALDRPARKVYREYILRELRQMYRHVAERDRAPTPFERIAMVRTLREWDALTVVPRFGFDDVDDYYTTCSVAGDLDDLTVPALLVVSEHDPMIPASTIRPLVDHGPEHLDIEWVDTGGHVFFPAGLNLGLGEERGVAAQVMHWFERHQP